MRRNQSTAGGLVLLLLLCDIPQAVHAELGEIIEKFEMWDVHRSEDMMTDNVSCLATYRDDKVILLSEDNFSVWARGPKRYTFRIDETPESAMNLVSDIEQLIGLIEIKDHATIINSNRLRVRVVTYSGLKEFDIKMKGAADAVNFMKTSDRCKN